MYKSHDGGLTQQGGNSRGHHHSYIIIVNIIVTVVMLLTWQSKETLVEAAVNPVYGPRLWMNAGGAETCSDDDGHDFDRDGENIDDVDDDDYDDVNITSLDGCRVLYPLPDPVDSGTRHIGLGWIRYEHHHVSMTAAMIAMNMKVLIILVLTLGQQ